MASSFYHQLFDQSYYTETIDKFNNFEFQNEKYITYNYSKIYDQTLPPVKWGNGSVNDSEYEGDRIHGPVSDLDIFSQLGNKNRYVWLLVQPTSITGQNITILSGVRTDEPTETYSIEVDSKYVYMIKNVSSVRSEYRKTLCENLNYIGVKLLCYGASRQCLIFFPQKSNTITWNSSEIFVLQPSIYSPIFYSYSEPNISDNGSGKIAYSLNHSVINQPVIPIPDTIVNSAGLWKEVRFSQNLTLKFIIKSKISKGGGWGYDYTSVKFVTSNLQYEYELMGEKVVAHTTVSYNKLGVHSYGGSLPTDFKVNSFEVIQDDSEIYIDYWDTSNMFKNMNYVRDLQSQANSATLQSPANYYEFSIPVGTWPYVSNTVNPSVPGKILLQYKYCSLSTQYTDSVAINSLRFCYSVKANTQWGLFAGNGSLVRSGLGFAIGYDDTKDESKMHQYVVNVTTTLISLVPSNDEYRTPISASTTVRKDLEREIRQLREEFNDLTEKLALQDILGIAMAPFSIADFLSSIPNIAAAAKDLTSSLMKTTKRVKSKGVKRLTKEDIFHPHFNDFRLPRVKFNPDTIEYDDISAAVLRTVTPKVARKESDINHILSSEFSKSFENKTYRIINKDGIFESHGSKVVHYSTNLEFIGEYNINKMWDLAQQSPVLSAIVDFNSIKILRDNYGVGLDEAFDLLSSKASTIVKFINDKNPVIRDRIKHLLELSKL